LMALIEASKEGNFERVKELLNKCVDINFKDNSFYGWTALMWASHRGHKNIVKLLIKNNANIDIQNDVGDTALIGTLCHGHIKIVKLLIVNNANINIQTNNG